jgi:hypothetical protein
MKHPAQIHPSLLYLLINFMARFHVTGSKHASLPVNLP